MSAICGIFTFGGTAAAMPAIERMVQALAHHGPDRQRHWSRPSIALGHCLLRMTAEDGFDPGVMHDTDGRYTLIADGRIDNRSELAAQWGLTTAQTRHWPDATFMLKAFAQWGSGCASHLYGDFCFAVWDSLERTLTLVRDPVGDGRSLFYYLGAGFVAFATAPVGLFALPEIPRELDETKLADFLILNHEDPHSTHYRNVRRLPPAHFLRLSAHPGVNTPQRYWQPDFAARLRYPRDADYVEAFNALFERVVADNLRSIHPVGAFMSGGVDSAAVAATAARQMRTRGQRLATFTAVPRAGFAGRPSKGRYNDETPLVQAIAALHDNIDTHFIAAEGATPLDRLGAYFEATEAPFRNPCNRVWIDAILGEAQSRGLRVMLTGQRGNFTLSWDGAWALGGWLRRGRWLALADGLRALHGYRQSSAYRYFKHAVKQALPDAAWRAYLSLRQGTGEQIALSSAINPDFAAVQQVFARAQAQGFDPGYRPPPDGRLARWKALTGVDYVGDLASGWRAAFGVEQRDPTGDRRLIEFCLAIPQRQFLGQGQSRWLAKRALADRLPPEVLHNRQRGAQDPGWHERLATARDSIRADLERMRADELSARVLNLDKLQHLVDHWPGADANWESEELTRAYRLCLNRGLMVGRFVQWFDGENR